MSASPQPGTSTLASDLTAEDVNVLVPDLTALDLVALRGLPDSTRPGIRDWHVSDPRNWRFREEIPLTLTGLEHLGLATCRNGWWKRTPGGDGYLHHLDAPPALQETLA